MLLNFVDSKNKTNKLGFVKDVKSETVKSERYCVEDDVGRTGPFCAFAGDFIA